MSEALSHAVSLHPYFKIREGNLEIVKALVEKGADINRKSLTSANRTPLDLADRHGDAEISAYLRSKGAAASKPKAN